MIPKFFLFTFALCFAGLASGADIYVPDHQPTVQDAIVTAVPGDTVVVRPGTYVENIDFLGKAITVKSELGPDVTTLDGDQAGSVVTFRSGETAASVLEGFTITNGTGTDIAGRLTGGGALCGPASSPTITGNLFTNNTCDDGGGIAAFDHSSPVITNNIFNSNICKNGGAINNENFSSPTITGNMITENVAPVYGGGIRCADDSDALIENNIIADNSAHAGRGGGIYNYHSAPTIRNNIVSGNLCMKCGGGIYNKVSAPLIENNLIFNNTTTAEYGGGIQCSTYAYPTIRNNVIYGNKAYLGGGGINCYNFSSPVIYNNIIMLNYTDMAGGGIMNLESATTTIFNCTIVANTAGDGGGGISCVKDADVSVANTIIWNNSAPVGPDLLVGTALFPATLTISHSDLLGGQPAARVSPGSTLNWGAGMIDALPGFVDPTNGDYHITANSPCRDGGNNSYSGLPGEDFEKDPRIADSAVDIGADEFHEHLYHMGDVIPGSSISIRVIGTPGKRVTLALGSGIQNPAVVTPHGDLHLSLPLAASWNLGQTSPEGTRVMNATVPLSWASGGEYPFQALIGAWGSADARLTNLLILDVE